jgi:hypothetical protein
VLSPTLTPKQVAGYARTDVEQTPDLARMAAMFSGTAPVVHGVPAW